MSRLQQAGLMDGFIGRRLPALASGTPESEYDRMGAILADPSVTWIGICTVSVWGRRPG